jgi:hypothetical protein
MISNFTILNQNNFLIIKTYRQNNLFLFHYFSYTFVYEMLLFFLYIYTKPSIFQIDNFLSFVFETQN